MRLTSCIVSRRVVGVVAFACLLHAGALAAETSVPATQNDDTTSVTKPGESAKIRGIQWTLVELAGKPVASGSKEGAITLRLDPVTTSVQGSTGINRMMGAYELDDHSLKFGRVATTRRAGPPELMEQETAFLKAIGSTTGFQAENGKLVLLQGETPVAKFEAP